MQVCWFWWCHCASSSVHLMQVCWLWWFWITLCFLEGTFSTSVPVVVVVNNTVNLLKCTLSKSVLVVVVNISVLTQVFRVHLETKCLMKLLPNPYLEHKTKRMCAEQKHQHPVEWASDPVHLRLLSRLWTGRLCPLSWLWTVRVCPLSWFVSKLRLLNRVPFWSGKGIEVASSNYQRDFVKLCLTYVYVWVTQ